MNTTHTSTDTQTKTFTRTNAEDLASKVKVDLKRLSRQSDGKLSLDLIDDLHDELVLLLIYDFVKTIKYGLVCNGKWVTGKAFKYELKKDNNSSSNDDPGDVYYADTPKNAYFTSLVSYTDRWWDNPDERKKFKEETPVPRKPSKGFLGTWQENQKNYSSGGRRLTRGGT